MPYVIKFLQFFRLVDADGLLSLTNIALIIGMYKIAVTQGTNLNDAGLLVAVLLNYAHKRFINKE